MSLFPLCFIFLSIKVDSLTVNFFWNETDILLLYRLVNY